MKSLRPQTSLPKRYAYSFIVIAFSYHAFVHSAFDSGLDPGDVHCE